MPERMLDDPAEWDNTGTPTRTVRQVIIAECQVGMPGEIAAQYAGISYRTWKRWISEGRAVLRRLVDEPDADLSDDDARMAQFATDVQAAQAFWVRNANVVLETSMRSRTRVTTKVKTERQVGADGQTRDVEVERQVVTAVEPVELGPLMWRMAKLAPQVYGPTQKIELTGADGGPVDVDIGKRLDDVLSRIADSVTVDDVDPTATNGHTVDP